VGFDLANRIAIAQILFFVKELHAGAIRTAGSLILPRLQSAVEAAARHRWQNDAKTGLDFSGVAEPRDATDVIAFEEFGRPGRRVFGPRRPEPANRNGAPDRRAPN